MPKIELIKPLMAFGAHIVGPAPYAKVRGASEQCIACRPPDRQRL